MKYKNKVTIIASIIVAIVSALAIYVNYKYLEYKFRIDYTDMKYSVETLDTSSLSEYMVSLEEYTSIRKKKRQEEIEKLGRLLPHYVSSNMIYGTNSEYFMAYCTKEYSSLYSNINNMLAQMPYVSMKYNTYKDIVLLKECVVPDCDVIEFYDKYVTGDILDMLKVTHLKYESMINYEAQKIQKANKDFVDMYYQEYLCTDMGLIKQIEVDWELSTPNSKHKYKVKFNEEDRELLSNIELYRCHNFYDGEFHELAASSMATMTLDSEMKYTNIGNVTYSLAGLDERDIYNGVFSVIKCLHSEPKSIESMRTELETKARITEAEQIVYESILENIEKIRGESISEAN